LRGINVGKKQLKMADLKAVYEGLNCKNVTTYIQSGNVICKCGDNVLSENLSKKAEKKILEQHNITTPVITITIDELKTVITANPFVKQPGIDAEKLHVTFLAEVPQHANLDKIQQYNYPPDKFIIIHKQAYLYCPVNYGNTKLSNTFFESKLKVTATTRNWRTVNTLLQLAEEK